MKVSAANAAPGSLDQCFTGRGGGFWDVFDADVPAVIETSCFHDVLP